MPSQLVAGLRRFKRDFFPAFKERYQELVRDGQKPGTLFLGCADSRVDPHLLTDAGPGELFVLRNVGNLVPPFEPDAGFHGTSAGIEFATLLLEVKDIVICGHSHCGAIAALYQPSVPETPHITRWLELARPAMVPDPDAPDALRRTEMRSLVLQLERLLSYPMVKQRVEAGSLALHAWYYIIEEGSVLELDLEAVEFRPLNG